MAQPAAVRRDKDIVETVTVHIADEVGLGSAQAGQPVTNDDATVQLVKDMATTIAVGIVHPWVAADQQVRMTVAIEVAEIGEGIALERVVVAGCSEDGRWPNRAGGVRHIQTGKHGEVADCDAIAGQGPQ